MQKDNIEYLKHLQSNIDELERELFSDNIVPQKDIDKIKINRDLCNPIQTTETTLEDNTLTITNVKNPYVSTKEKQDLYQIIMKEREKNGELEKIRYSQNEKFKESQSKCKELEQNNMELRESVDELQKEKELQEIKILELQKEIDKLRVQREKKINNKNEALNQRLQHSHKNLK